MIRIVLASVVALHSVPTAASPGSAPPTHKRRPGNKFMFLGAVAVRVSDKPLPVCDETVHYRVPEDKVLWVLWVTIDPNSLDIDGDIWPIELQTKTQIVARRASGTVDQDDQELPSLQS
jgi:hypothetical protein